MNIDDLKEGLKRILPVLKTITKLTPNRYDNLVVEFLERLLNADNEQVAKAIGQ